MYVIKMNSDKSLITTIRSTIYKGENNADTLVFLLPVGYEGVNFAECDVLLEYISPEGNIYEEPLILEPDIYKGYYQYHLKIDSEFTKYPGENKLSLNVKNERTGYKLSTGSIYVRIYSTTDSEEISPNKASELDARVSKMENDKADKIHIHEIAENKQNVSLVGITTPNRAISNACKITNNTFTNNASWSDGFYITISGYVEFTISGAIGTKFKVDGGEYSEKISENIPTLSYSGNVEKEIYFATIPPKGTVTFDKFINATSGFMSGEQATKLVEAIQKIEELSNRISFLEAGQTVTKEDI